MAARFSRLRIAGFKSFAEPVELEIMPGLTGIVGPNGCGKSNVAEALRWVMGEASARSLRGGEMDDVIFAGTATRPSRNLAEVSITLGDNDGRFPPPFTGQAELQVVRRIERGAGSAYRVNGREARARDVQVLFADLASGARSSAMVSQGRVGAIVSARPEDRRSVLEEAAGIGGLHARRSEADAKLRAAEANLARAEDQRGRLEAQLVQLQKQADAAERYRTVCDGVRDAEAALLHLQHARVAAARAMASAAAEEAETTVVRLTAAAIAAHTAAGAAAAAIPGCRDQEATARTDALNARVSKETLDAEAARTRDALTAAVARAVQTARDLAHAERAQADAAAADARLAAEAERLEQAAAVLPSQIAEARALSEAAHAGLATAEAAAAEAAEAAAQSHARVSAATEITVAAETRARRATDGLARLRAERDRAARECVDPERLRAATAAAVAASAAVEAARDALQAAEHARAAALPAAAAARDAQGRADTSQAKLAAESGALAEVLGVRDNERWPPMVDRLDVPPGVEAALGAALGEDLAAAADPDAARHWRELPSLPNSIGGERLADLVRAPDLLARALSGIALVSDQEEGDARQAELTHGQCLVSRDGAVWRWDGYTVRAGTPTAAAVRLQQRNRLAALRTRLADANAVATAARAARAAADAAERAATAQEASARPACREAEQRFERTRQARDALRTQAERAQSKVASLDDAIGHAATEAADADAALLTARDAWAALGDPARLRAEADQARAAMTAARARDTAAARALDGLQREEAAVQLRRSVMVREREDWRMRAADAAGRATDLGARHAEAEREHAALGGTPDRLARRSESARAASLDADTALRVAGTALAAAEREAGRTAAAAAAADRALGAAREALARAEAGRAHAEQAWLDSGAAHTSTPPPADLSAAAEERARHKVERLLRERDAIGPVNLLAAQDAAEVETAMMATVRDRDELAAAIAKLRGSIGQLSREGRDRLAAVFQQVDRHFQTLFARMFGGGRAHLALVGSDDPLLAGLEIYAQPPGKKLSALSLLSGGEQALTALSLIFAVFRCNPAPVCVLDEVDAPLDDTNVDRFCSLLAEMVAEADTRFLVVTHHQLTMARMDRLYGVTMQERGVSRLLSVDLVQAVGIVEGVAAE